MLHFLTQESFPRAYKKKEPLFKKLLKKCSNTSSEFLKTYFHGMTAQSHMEISFTWFNKNSCSEEFSTEQTGHQPQESYTLKIR